MDGLTYGRLLQSKVVADLALGHAAFQTGENLEVAGAQQHG
jgi:hypothetical protein